MSKANAIDMPHCCRNGKGCPWNTIAHDAVELKAKFGFRMLNGKLAPQSLCIRCR